MGTYFKQGDYNVICDRTGFKLKGSDTRMEWNNLRVWKYVYDPKHPQLYPRPMRADRPIANLRPENVDVYLTAGEITAEDL